MTTASHRLNQILVDLHQPPLPEVLAQRFESYLALLLRWNVRTNLTAIRDEEGILTRHFAESILCARRLPPDLTTLLDFGSGAGFPGIPIALCRPDIAVTLAESQSKKAAFLQEAVRTLNLSCRVYNGRAEQMVLDGAERRFDCVTLRAVDHMHQAVILAADLVLPGGWIALMSTASDVARLTALLPSFAWQTIHSMPGTAQQCLVLGLAPNPAPSNPHPEHEPSGAVRRENVPRGTLRIPPYVACPNNGIAKEQFAFLTKMPSTSPASFPSSVPRGTFSLLLHVAKAFSNGCQPNQQQSHRFSSSGIPTDRSSSVV